MHWMYLRLVKERQMKVLKDNKNIKDLELLQKLINEENNLITN